MDKKNKEIKNMDVVERQKPMYAATVEDALVDTGKFTEPKIFNNHNDLHWNFIQLH